MPFHVHLIAILFFTLISISGSAFAAAQGMHVFLAEKWLAIQEWDYTPHQKHSFILGTLFPDIRYLGVLKREETHEQHLVKQDICEQRDDPFEAGRKLHVWIDEVRESFAERWNIYEQLPASVNLHKATFLKLLEDEIIWNELNIAFIQETLKYEEYKINNFNLKVEDIQKWHSLLSQYFQHSPAHMLSNLSKKNKGFFNVPKEEVAKWSELLLELKNNDIIRSYMTGLIEHLTKEFEPN